MWTAGVSEGSAVIFCRLISSGDILLISCRVWIQIYFQNLITSLVPRPFPSFAKKHENRQQHKSRPRAAILLVSATNCTQSHTNPSLSDSWRFSKLPETFRARKAILCAGYLPTEIQFSFVLKA